MVDRLGETNYLLHRAHFKGGSPPKPVPRPGVDPEPEGNGEADGLADLGGEWFPTTLSEAAAYFRTQREYNDQGG